MTNFSDTSAEAFWEMADNTSRREQLRIKHDLKSLKEMSLEELKTVFVQYRFFTHYDISDIALLISRLPIGSLRTILADVLNRKLGAGDPNDSHPALYDRFLLSIGVTEATLESADTSCIRTLWGVQQSLIANSWNYGIGLRGMSGDSLSQVYFSSMRESILQNEALVAIKDQIDWKFWDIHTVEVDLRQQSVVREAIDELIFANPEIAPDLIDGYRESVGTWERFWQQIFKAAAVSRKPKESSASEPLDNIARVPKRIPVAV